MSKSRRKIIEIDEALCDGCGQCVPSCAEGAIQVIDGKARLIAEKYCDGLGACLGECPNGALKITEREAEEFDEKAVEEYLEKKEVSASQRERNNVMSCPSGRMQSFSPSDSSQGFLSGEPASPTISNWPVQIRLVQPSAPFLKGADLTVAADCTPVVYPHFQVDFIKGRVVLIGCPKFDDKESYVKKFGEIFKTAEINSVTVVVMEVPCCQGLPAIVKRGMAVSGKKIPMETVILSARGQVLQRKKEEAA